MSEIKRDEKGRFLNVFQITHGATIDGKQSRLYRAWHNMKERCNNSDNPDYDRYGERGIKVCREWKKSFEKFRSWAINNGYSDDLEIDRIDNEKDYTPANCHWVTDREQARNRSSNHLLTYNGKTQTMIEWAEETGINLQTLSARINESNWPAEKALTTPVK